MNLGRALETLVVTETASYAAVEVLKKTILAGLMSALVIPASLISVMAVMDNPFSVAYSRARKAGQGTNSEYFNTILIDLHNFSVGRRAVTQAAG